MSYLLFLDESGHDHKVVPYEVHGGVCLSDRQVWILAKRIQEAEWTHFGSPLAHHGKEIKGTRLLGKKVFAWAAQMPVMEPLERLVHVKAFFERGRLKQTPTREGFTAYGQACLSLVDTVFGILTDLEATLFAVAFLREVKKPRDSIAGDVLRKDHEILIRHYYQFLAERHSTGLLVLDETDKEEDRRFYQKAVRLLEKEEAGEPMASHVIPMPFFVASDLNQVIQAADLCIYVLNWGFRDPRIGLTARVRSEIENRFGASLRRLIRTLGNHKGAPSSSESTVAFCESPWV